MLGKLIKYEFKAVNRLMIPLHLGLIAITIFGRFYVQLALNRPRFNDGNVWMTFADTSLIIFYVIALVAIALITSIYLSILRFQKNLFTDEGYLMHTLPVSVHEQIWGKLIVTTVWIAIDTVLLILSILVMLLNKDLISAVFDEVPTLFISFRDNFGVSPVAAGLVWIPLFVLSEMASILIYYMCITIGHSFHTHKILSSVGIFVGVTILSNVIAGILTGITATTYSTGTSLFSSLSLTAHMFSASWSNTTAFWLSSVISALIALVQGGICYWLTFYFMKNSLNLE